MVGARGGGVGVMWQITTPDDLSDHIARIQCGLRIMDLEITSERVQGYLGRVAELLRRDLPDVAAEWPLPWLKMAQIPNEVVVLWASQVDRQVATILRERRDGATG